MFIKQKIITIVGPTASGKTNLSIKIALMLKKQGFFPYVISADSRQVYKNLNIGTAKILKKDMRDIPHFMIDIANPKKRYSVAEYQKEAKKVIQKQTIKAALPIIVGGTGLYIDALIYNWKLPEVPPNKMLRKKLENKPDHELIKILEKLNPEKSKTIDNHNKVRLIRAIEIAQSLKIIPKLEKSSPYNVIKIGIKIPVDQLKERINERLKIDLKRGLIEEIKKLHKNKLSWKRLNELGLEYRYVSEYLRNLISYEDMMKKIKIGLWHYAKRQITWFKRNKEIQWISDTNEAIKLVSNFLES